MKRNFDSKKHSRLHIGSSLTWRLSQRFLFRSLFIYSLNVPLLRNFVFLLRFFSLLLLESFSFCKPLGLITTLCGRPPDFVGLAFRSLAKFNCNNWRRRIPPTKPASSRCRMALILVSLTFLLRWTDKGTFCFQTAVTGSRFAFAFFFCRMNFSQLFFVFLQR